MSNLSEKKKFSENPADLSDIACCISPRFQDYKSAFSDIQMTKQPTLILYYDYLRDILTFVNRKGLGKLRLVNRSYYDIIDKEFSTTPYLILPKLIYFKCNWQWILHHYSEPSLLLTDVREQIFATKFIKFEHIQLVCDFNLKPTDLVPMSHLWEVGELNISWKKDSLLTPKIAALFGKCNSLLATPGNGSVSLLADLLSNGSPSIRITDHIYNPVMTNVSWQAIIEYLYLSDVDRKAKRCLHITTKLMANRKECIQFIDAVKTRFQVAVNRLAFCFVWHSGTKNEASFEPFRVHNSKSSLSLSDERTGFYLSTM